MKRKKWVKFRHKVIRNVAEFVLRPYILRKYGLTVENEKIEKGKQYLALFNHQTGFDQFFVGLCFPSPVYFVATEDIFSLGLLSSLLKYAAAPIPIQKSTSDVRAVMNAMRVAKEGGTIALAPEGNRTFHGKTCSMKQSVAKFARALRLPIAFLKIEGGYFVHPRWSDEVRRGKMKISVTRVLEVEEMNSLSDDELFSLIEGELSLDEREPIAPIKGKNLAEYLERVAYVCPDCGLSAFRSEGDDIFCEKCHLGVRLLPDGALKGIAKPFPFARYAEWYEYQVNFIHTMEGTEFLSSPAYEERVNVYSVTPYKNKKLLSKNALFSLYSDRYELFYGDKKMSLPFERIFATSVLGKNKLNVYAENQILQVKADKRFNPVKYMNFYYHFQNQKQGERVYEFLGL